MMNKWVGGAALTVLVGAGLFTGGIWWRGHVARVQASDRLIAAERALRGGNAAGALTLVELNRRVGPVQNPADAARWNDLEIEAATAARQIVRLAALHQVRPEDFERHEAAATMVCRLLQARPDTAPAAAALREAWRGREKLPGAWLAVDADALIRAGHTDEALAFLKANPLPGRADAARLLRLALLAAGQGAPALQYLDEALKADPAHPDVRSFRGQVFESQGRGRAARVEYLAACAAQPDNPLLWEQLADFYHRAGSLALEGQVWKAAVTRGTLDVLWLRAWFWSHAGLEAGIDWKSAPAPTGPLSALCERLRLLPAGRAWDEAVLTTPPEPPASAAARPEVTWLRIIQYLKDGREPEALHLLDREAAGAVPLEPGLAATLKAIAEIRAGGTPSARTLAAIPADRNGLAAHPLHIALHNWTAAAPGGDAELAALLRSPDAWVAAFLASGWMEAALYLQDPATDRSACPAWLVYGLAQSLNQARGPQAAFDFAARQKIFPALAVLLGETRLALNDRAGAMKWLEPLATTASPEGVQAALWIALCALEDGKPAAAAAAVERNATLAAAVSGRELRARALWESGRKDEARSLFRALEADSPVAKDFLATLAFNEGRWDEAERLTRELTELLPDEPRYFTNLRAIAAARAKAATP